jgi:hypothetical protein
MPLARAMPGGPEPAGPVQNLCMPAIALVMVNS